MKATSRQTEILNCIIDTMVCLRDSNDISSPSHYVDMEMEVAKLDLDRADEVKLSDKIAEIITMIQVSK